MKHIVWVVLSLWLLPVYGQQPKQDDASNLSIAETTWGGLENDKYYEFGFLADGQLSYETEDDYSISGTWQQDGSNVFMEFNNRYSEYQGKIDGKQMQGSAWNKNGEKWTWLLKKKSIPPIGDIKIPKVSPPYSGSVKIMPSVYRQAISYGGKNFSDGTWLALACNSELCSLVNVGLTVVTSSRVNIHNTAVIQQRLHWDLSSLGVLTHVVVFIEPTLGLKAGGVTTWYRNREWPDPSPNANSNVEKLDISVATPAVGEPSRQSIVAPVRLEDSIRIKLTQGGLTQWLGDPLTVICSNVYSPEERFPSNYVQWVGDLDGDRKPDYILWLGLDTGYRLYLSSLALSGELVHEAGKYYQDWDQRCD